MHAFCFPCFCEVFLILNAFNDLYLAFGIVIDGLKKNYKEAMDRDDVKAIVLTGELLLPT